MIERKTVSQCVSEDYCKGWNDAVDAMPKWISTEEMLPQKAQWVLTYCGGYANWFELNKWCGDNWLKIMPVTHWMPLPEPPKEEAHGSETGEKADGWTYRYIAQLEANQIKGRCKDCKYVIRDTRHGKISDDFVCGDGWTNADGYCDEWEPKEDAHGTETGEKHEAQEMADEGPGEAGTEPV